MNINSIIPRKALNKAYLKIKPNRSEIEKFKTFFIQLLDHINDSESEEFHKNLISDFLKKTYYDANYFINTKGRNDLVIHNGDKATSSVGVIIEAKKITNKVEMLKAFASNDSLNTKISKINVKAFHELVLYYLRERITNKNIELKYLIATNVYEWFIFDSQLFDRIFAQNKNLIKQFNDFENERLSEIKTDFFYKQIVEPFINNINHDLEFIYFDIRNYEKILRNQDKKDDIELIALFKLFTPENLLKLPFVNDSNSLDKRFYDELLHIIGLIEIKEGGKKLIQRKSNGERNSGSLIENAIIQLDSLDKISRLISPEKHGLLYDERLFNVGLELSITWINRILFLKLLEAQLITYHKGDKTYEFLNYNRINDYDDLNSLFFQVLARKNNERNDVVKKLYEKVPYLNSSLFEPTEIEQLTIFINQLNNTNSLPLHADTILKDEKGKKKNGSLNPLEYLFNFLNAYDFTNVGGEEIQEDNKTLINASVLGLIFEKINGYKDGSFFTPGFITMFMARETIRGAVVQKFNEAKGWKCTEFEQLYNKIEDSKEANRIINEIKICDPAVGSGHFLVSALNEIIAVKNDLRILQDKDGNRLKEYQLEVINDELIVTDEDGKLVEYNFNNKESQRIQVTLFHEKQTIIENCLFGVDINPNSVKICRLRLWIELLKNAYYKNESELETLPNIDINIKNGNSLVSRFKIDSDLKQSLKNSTGKWTIESYRLAVDTYRNAQNKEQKREMERLINDIKSNFRSEISLNDPKVKKLRALNGELFQLTNQGQLFELSKKQENIWNEKVKFITAEIKKIEFEIEEIKSNIIYLNAFEWRFEFPEILDNNGDFVGFDAIIGNPPYIQLQKLGSESDALQKMGYETFTKTGDIYSLFYELGFNILKEKGILSFITSNKWMRAAYGESLRDFFVNKTNPEILIDFSGNQIFDTATVDTNILMFTKDKNRQQTLSCTLKDKLLINLSDYFRQNSSISVFNNSASWVILSEIEKKIKEKIEAFGVPLKEWNINIYRGILTGFNEAFIIDGKMKEALINEDHKSAEIIRPILRGRDINKFSYNFADLWLINTHNGLKENGLMPININNYPAIKKHLDKYITQIEKRSDKGDSPYNLRNCAYIDDFNKPKIIFPNMTKFLPFTYDNKSFLTNQKCYIITGENVEYLTAFLNSSLFKFCFRDNFPELQGGTRELSKIFFDKIPIKKVNEITNNEFKVLIEQINALKINNNSTKEIEIKIDNMISDIYNLSENEKKVIGFIEIQ